MAKCWTTNLTLWSHWPQQTLMSKQKSRLKISRDVYHPRHIPTFLGTRCTHPSLITRMSITCDCGTSCTCVCLEHRDRCMLCIRKSLPATSYSWLIHKNFTDFDKQNMTLFWPKVLATWAESNFHVWTNILTKKFIWKNFGQKTLTYFVRGNITGRATSCLICLDLAALLLLI